MSETNIVTIEADPPCRLPRAYTQTRWPAGPPLPLPQSSIARWSLRLDDCKQVLCFNALAWRDEHLCDLPIERGIQIRLHLHRFQRHQLRASLHVLIRLDGDTRDHTRRRRANLPRIG